MKRYYVEIIWKDKTSFSLETVYASSIAEARINAVRFAQENAGYSDQIIKKVIVKLK